MTNLSKRRFLQYISAATALGTLSPHSLLHASRFSGRKIGVALLGLGGYSNGLLAPALQTTHFCKLSGLITGTPSKLPSWQARYGIPDTHVYTYDEMDKLANNPDIDVVYVVTPTSTHLKFAKAAADAGKHVWCEKPMAMTVTECEEMAQHCRKNGVRLSLGYRMMHEPNTRYLRQYANTRPFGNMASVISEAGYAGNGQAPDNWRMKKAMGGGALYDMGVYPINGARFMTMMEPIAVTARHEKSHPHIFTEVDETTYLDLEFANGLVAKCATSVVKNMNRLRVECQNGWYQLAPMQGYSGVTGSDSKGLALPPMVGSQQALQMDNDALALLGNGPFLTRPDDGMHDIHIVQSAFESAKTGKRVVL
jgi:glucose-fructose oxidoreductase